MALYFWTSTSSTDPSVGANWTKSDGTTGTAPTTGDDAVVQVVPGSTLAVIAAKDMHTVVLNSLTVNLPQTSTPTIGNAGVGGYWQISATTGTIIGGSRVKIDFGTNQTNCSVASSQASADSGQETVRVIGSHASNVFTALPGGNLGIATNQAGETATAATVNVSGAAAVCNTGSGVTLTNVNVAGSGTYSGNGSISGTLTIAQSSTATVSGSGTIATVSNSGTANLKNTGTITTINNYSSGTADASGNPASRTWSTANIYPGSKIIRNAANPTHLTITTRVLLGGVGTESFAA